MGTSATKIPGNIREFHIGEWSLWWCTGKTVRDPLRTHAIPNHLRGVFTMRCYTNPRLPYFTLPVLVDCVVLNYLYFMCRQILKARLNVPHDVIIGYEVCDLPIL